MTPEELIAATRTILAGNDQDSPHYLGYSAADVVQYLLEVIETYDNERTT